MKKTFIHSLKPLLLLLCCMLAINRNAEGQSKSKPNILYVELGGNGLLTSINYERQLLKTRRLNFHIGTGIYGNETTYLTIPFGINYLIDLDDSESYVDIGLGATYSKADVTLYTSVKRSNLNYTNTHYWAFIPNVGYRKYTKRNMMYRFSLTPVINQYGFLPYVGISVGKRF